MLITIPVEELRENDVLNGDFFPGQSEEDTKAITLSRKLIVAAFATETRWNDQQERASRVIRRPRVGRMYVHLTMGTYAVVTPRKGDRVSVYRNGENGAQDAPPAVLEATEKDEYADKPAGFVDEGGVASRHGQRPEPFGYVRSQFGKLGTVEDAGVYKLQIWGENSNHTKWLNVHPDDLAKIQEILELRETEENCPHRVYLAGVCTLCGKRETS